MSSSEPLPANPHPRSQLDPPRRHPVRRRPCAGGQRRDLDGRGLVSPPGNRGPRHPATATPTWSSSATTIPCRQVATISFSTKSTLKRTRNTRGILIGTSRTNPGKDVTEPAHLSDPERTAQLRTVHRALSSLRSRRPRLDRRRRHAQIRQQVQAHPGVPSRRRTPHRGRPRAQDDRQRLPGNRLHLRLLHRGRNPRQRDPQPPRRCRGRPDVLPGRNHGPKRGLARLRRGHRRRG